ncbi:MAG: TetR/AcrR family transcriptional regulator [Pseudonocardia sp.]|nr:TetR/AcrR family transcriptional regulator [Pseudonocardia sp.]
MDSPANGRPGDARARAAQTKRDRTRRALLDAAGATFGSQGWARSRMEDIAATAGVSAATAYNHFPSRHALIGHVYGPLVGPLMTQAEQDIAADRPVVEALQDQVRTLARITFRHQRLTGAFWAAVQEYTIKVSGPAAPDDDIDPRTLAPIPEPLTLLIAHGQRLGVLRTFPPAAEISSIVVNLLLLRSINQPHEPPEDTAELLLTVMFGSLRPQLLSEDAGGGAPFREGR